MTAREFLARRKRRVMRVVYVAWGVCMMPVFIGAVSGLLVLAFVGFLVFMVGFFTLLYGHAMAFRCPWCRENLAPLVLLHAGLTVDGRFQFCPYCGHRLDEELPEAETVSVGDSH